MALANNIVDGLDGTMASVVGVNTLAPAATENAQVVIHRSDDPILAAIQTDVAIVGQGGQTAAGNNILLPVAGTGWTDVSNFRAISLQVIPVGTITAGTIVFEGSNDGNGAVAMLFVDKANMSAAPVSSVGLATGVNRFMLGNVFFKYFRARISVAVAGPGAGVGAVAMGLSGELSFAIQAIRVTDGTISQALKVANTPAASADIGAVVTLSPNLPVPTTTFLNSAATTNATVAKAAAGTVYSIALSNTNGGVRYFKLYNLPTTPIVGTTVPVITNAIPANGSIVFEFGMLGVRLGTGISFAITANAVDTDATAIAAGEVKVMLSYI